MTTPLGDIEICIDGKTIKYTAQNITADNNNVKNEFKYKNLIK